MRKFRVYFLNFDYHMDKEFDDSESALEAGKKACFEFAIQEFLGKVMVRTISAWSPIGGTKYFV